MSLRVFVEVWCEVDPTLSVRVDRRTGSIVVDEGDILMRVAPLGRYGVTEALSLRDTEVTAFAVGENNENALVHALAAGASRAVSLRHEGPADDANAGALMAKWFENERPDLVIADRRCGEAAGGLGWAHLAGLSDLDHDGKVLSARRQLGRGAYEEVTAVLPAIVRLQAENVRTSYVAQARIARARALSIESCNLPVLSQPPSALEAGMPQLARPRTRVGRAPSAPARAADRLNALMGISGRSKPPAAMEVNVKGPSDLAEEFVRYINHHGLRLGGAGTANQNDHAIHK